MTNASVVVSASPPSLSLEIAFITKMEYVCVVVLHWAQIWTSSQCNELSHNRALYSVQREESFILVCRIWNKVRKETMWQLYLPHSTGQEIAAINFILQVLIIISTICVFLFINVIAYLMHICFVTQRYSSLSWIHLGRDFVASSNF